MLLYVIVMVRDFVTYFVFYFLLFSREFVHFSIISKFEFFFFFGDIFEIREKKNVLTVFFLSFFFCSSLFEHTGGLHAWGDHKSGQLGLGASGIAGTFFNDCFYLP